MSSPGRTSALDRLVARAARPAVCVRGAAGRLELVERDAPAAPTSATASSTGSERVHAKGTGLRARASAPRMTPAQTPGGPPSLIAPRARPEAAPAPAPPAPTAALGWQILADPPPAGEARSDPAATAALPAARPAGAARTAARTSPPPVGAAAGPAPAPAPAAAVAATPARGVWSAIEPAATPTAPTVPTVPISARGTGASPGPARPGPAAPLPAPGPPHVLIDCIEIITPPAQPAPADPFASLADRRSGRSRHAAGRR